MNPQFWWFLARASGLVAWALLTLTTVWGLLLRTKLLRRPAAPALLELHRMLAALAVLFTAVHLAALVADSYVRFGPAEILVPFVSEWKPVPVALGVLALYLLVAVAVTSALLSRLPRRWWARVHRLAYLLFWCATVHTLTAGTDARHPAVAVGAAAAVGAVMFLTLVRMLADPPLLPRFHRLRVADVRRETPDAVSVAFAVPEDLTEEFRFRPGQHLTLRAEVDGEDIRRPYSICSGPGDGELRVAVKRVPGGRMSGWVHRALRPGQTVDVMAPAGQFGPGPGAGSARHVLLAGAGSGITPLLSIAAWLLATEPDGRVTLLYGNRTRADILFRDRLADLTDRHPGRFRVVHVLSRERAGGAYAHGRITPDRLTELAGPPAEVDEAYLCGPQELTSALAAQLRAAGAEVHVEQFGAAPQTGPGSGPAQLTIRHAGRSATVTTRAGETVLDAGLRAGLDLPYSCRAGACGTCLAVAGQNPILTCRPASLPDGTVVSYDLT